MNNELREASKDWLFREDWYRGENRSQYDEMVSGTLKAHSLTLKRLMPGSIHFKFPTLLNECIAASFRKATWENF